MIKPEELYNKTKILVDMALLNKLLEKYASIPINELDFSLSADEGYKNTLGYSRLSSALYNQINCLQQTTTQNEKLRIDKENFILKVRQDFINSGINFNPELHGGSTNPLTVQPGWYTFKSWNLLGTAKIHNSNQLHRFYIGIASNDKYDFANELYSEFKNTNIPFYFKVDRSLENRPDKIVIYTSTDLLDKTMNVLETIENRRPDLMQRCISPSIIVGKVTDKIGYASEFPSSGVSFTQIICNCLANAIESTINEYIKGSINPSIKKIYDEKVLELQKRGYFLEINGKKKIATDVLMKYDSDFKVKILNSFENNLVNAGIDLNNMCFSKQAKKEIEKQYNPIENNKIDIFAPDVLNRVITLPNGKIMTIDEYLKRNRVWSLIPLNSTVTLQTLGISMSGSKFIENVIKRASQFNDIQDFFKVYGVIVDRNNSKEKVEEMISQNLDNIQKDYEEDIHMSR